MVVELLTEKTAEDRPLFSYLIPRRRRGGAEPEQRVVFGGVSWEDYLAFDRALGEDRQNPRLFYLDGELEIVSTSEGHDEIKTWLGGFVEDFLLERGIRAFPRGQATMSRPKKAVAEPDESWCLHTRKEVADLVIEVALSSGGVSKLETYQRLGVREVWIWRKDRVEVWALQADHAGYAHLERSVLLPDFDFDLLGRCIAMRPKWNEGRLAFRDALRAKPD